MERRTLFSVVAQLPFAGPVATVDPTALGGSDASVTGGANLLPGYDGRAWSFNGGGEADFADRPDLDPAGRITVSAWINAADWDGNRRIVQKSDVGDDDQYRLLAEDGQLKFDLSEVGTAAASLPSTGAWHFVAGTYDGTNVELYVDGSLVGQQQATGQLAVTSGPLAIGNKPGSGYGGDHFKGAIDQVEISPDAMSSSDLQSLQAAYTPAPLTAPDASGNGHAAALVGGASFVPGRTGTALGLDGQSGEADVPDAAGLDPTSQMTVSAWVDATAWDGNRRIVQKSDPTSGVNNGDNQYRLTAENGRLVFDLYGVGSVDAQLPATGSWHQVTATYDGTRLSLYVDGLLAGARAATGSIPTGSGPLAIGSKPGSTAGGDHFHGAIGDVEVDDNALTANQVSARYQTVTRLADADVGSPAYAGSSSFDGTTWTVNGGGADVYNSSDQFHFASEVVTGDVGLVARVASQTNTDPQAKAGVMVRASDAPGAAYAFVFVTPSNRVWFQYRTADGATASLGYDLTGAAPPTWVQLLRTGNTFLPLTSSDGYGWTQWGGGMTVSMPPSALAGLAVTAHDDEALGTATFTNVSATTAMVGSGWTAAAVGGASGGIDVDAAGNATVTATGSIAQDRENYAYFGEASDSFAMAYQPLGSNQQLSAQVTGQRDTDGLAKAGLMIRGSTDANAPFVGLFATPDWGVVMLTRSSTGGYVARSPHDSSYSDRAGPVWLRLTTQAVNTNGTNYDRYVAYASLDGSAWAEVGEVTLPAGTLGGNRLACVAADATGSFGTDPSAAASTATFAHLSVGAIDSAAITPEIPYNVGAEAFSGSDGRVVWQPLVGADTVTVQCSTDGGATFHDVATVPGTADTFLPTGLLPNTTYLYRLLAANEAGTSPASPAVRLTTTGQLLFGTYRPSMGPSTATGDDVSNVVASSVPIAADSPRQALLRAASGSSSYTPTGASYPIGGFAPASSGAGYYGNSFGYLFDTNLTYANAASPADEPTGAGGSGTQAGRLYVNNTAGQPAADPNQRDESNDDDTDPDGNSTRCDCPYCCDLAATEQPVGYADGSPIFTISDLSTSGFTGGWSILRNYTTQTQFVPDGTFGYGWTNNRQTFLENLGGDPANPDVMVVNTAYKQVQFAYQAGSGGYAPTAVSFDQLTHDAAARTYTWFNPETGAASVYYDFASGTAANLQGKLKYTADAGGNRINLNYNAQGQLTTVTQTDAAAGTEVFAYSYFTSGRNAGQVRLVQQTLRRPGASTPTLYRQAVYSYYQGTYAGADVYGNQGDLQAVVVEDGNGIAIDSDYYRYYTPGDLAAGQAGFVGGLKYAFSPTNFARLSAATGGSPFTATDTQAAQYAGNYFTYDADHRATKEVAGAAGSSDNGGQGTDTLAYYRNPAFPTTGTLDYNTWWMRTTETTPDGTVNVVYTNVGKQALLAITTTDGYTEVTGWQFDAFGRPTATILPSAMNTSYYATANRATFEAHADLGISAGGAKASAGLVETTTYYTAPTGPAFGFVQADYVKQGLSGAPIQQDAYTYTTSTDAGNRTMYHVASATQYRNDDGSGGETTGISYDAYYAGTNQPSLETVTAPSVSTGDADPSAAANKVAFDRYGNAVWTMDARGLITYTGYDVATGGVVQAVQDVDTAHLPALVDDAVPLPSGWHTPTGNGLNLVTSMRVDDLGRTTEATSPEHRVTYVVYDDPDHEVRVYAGWGAQTGTAAVPTQVYREDWAGGYAETLTLAGTPAVAGGPGTYAPTGAEPIAAANLRSLSRTLTDDTGQAVETDDYFNLAGLTYSAAAFHLPSTQTSYYNVTATAYDAGGRAYQSTDANGTVDRVVYDGFGNARSLWVGTDPAALTRVAALTYDADNDPLTQTTYPGLGQTARVTANGYDWRDRPVLETSGVGTTAAMVYATTYDNLGEATTVRQYAGAANGTTFAADANNAPLTTAANNALLRAKAGVAYDDRGQAYRQTAYGVNQSTGSPDGTSFSTDAYFDASGQMVASSDPYGLWSKYAYDGAGRVSSAYQTNGIGGAFAGAGADVVLSQAAYTYDADGNVLETVTADRFDNDAIAATGTLGGPGGAGGPAARVGYAVGYYDAAGRTVAAVDAGTNGSEAYARPAVSTVASAGAADDGSGYTTITDPSLVDAAFDPTGMQVAVLTGAGAGDRAVVSAFDPGTGTLTLDRDLSAAPSGLPAAGSTYVLAGGADLVAQQAYDDAGRAAVSVDPRGLAALTRYDALGRTTATVANDVPNQSANNSRNQTVGYAYDGDDHVTSMTAVVPGQADQVTSYAYGVTMAAGNGVNDNDLLASITYPATGRAGENDAESYTYDATGAASTYTDRDGTTHQYSYDALGRLTGDAVSQFGNTAIDESVWSLGYAYDDAGRLSRATSRDGSNAVVNDVLRTYDDYGQVAAEYQSHAAGQLASTSSPAVTYAYDAAAGDRLASMSYPSGGRTLNYHYAGLPSQLTGLSDGNGTIQGYAYLGTATPVTLADGNGVTLSYVGGVTQDGTTDAGDRYGGLDRFGRVSDQRWTSASAGTVDDLRYAYDADSNVTLKTNTAIPNDIESFGYDGLNRLTVFSRYTTNVYGGPASAAVTETWGLDAAGNWTRNATTQAGSPTQTTTRTTDGQNQVKTLTPPGGSPVTLGYDDDGNTLADQTGQRYAYDAWNRLTAVRSAGGTTVASYGYDALGRRTTEAHGSTTTDLYYDTSWQLVEEQQNGTATAQYVWSPFYVDGLVERDDHQPGTPGTGLNRRLYAEQDADYNTTSLTDASGAVVERYEYEPYGTVTVLNQDGTTRGTGGASASQYGWVYLHQGLRLDVVTGLYDDRMRETYDPTLGRFLQQDPAGYVDGCGLYAVDQNNPVIFVDPTGLSVKGFLKGFVVGAVNTVMSIIHFATDPYNASEDAGRQIGHDYVDLRRNNFTRSGALLTATCHAVPVGQSAAALSDMQWGRSGYGFDYGRRLLDSDYGERSALIAADVSLTTVAGVKSLNAYFGQRPTPFINMMDPVESARYLQYWSSEATDVSATRQRLQVQPFYGGRILRDWKISSLTDEVYCRDSIYDNYGRLVGTNDWTAHGRPGAHAIPHYHVYVPGTGITVKPRVRPGLHPMTPEGAR